MSAWNTNIRAGIAGALLVSPLSVLAQSMTDEDGYLGVHHSELEALYLPPPPYPAQAQARGEEADCIVLLQIDEAGAVASAEVTRCSAAFEGVLSAAARSWRFAPHLVDGVPVPVNTRYPVKYRLVQARRDGSLPTVELDELKTRVWVNPSYPVSAKRMGVEGDCVVEVLLDERGVPTRAEEITGCQEAFQTELVRVAALWRFEPYLEDGVAAPMVLRYPVKFRLLDEYEPPPQPTFIPPLAAETYRPSYPRRAARLGWEDTCTVHIVADEAASPESLEVSGCRDTFAQRLERSEPLWAQLARPGVRSILVVFQVAPCPWPQHLDDVGDALCISP